MQKPSFLVIAAAAALSLVTPVVAQTPTEGTTMPVPSKSGYAPVNGVEVYYAVYGEGEPVVLLHGGFGAIEMFGPVLGLLAEGHQVIGVDLQAHGRTLPHDRPMTFENMGDDIAALIGWLGHDKADVMGYSTGGGVALRVGIQHPEMVDKLILVSTPFARSGWHQSTLDGMAQIGTASAQGMKQTPMYGLYSQIAPDISNWTKLHEQQGKLVNAHFDYAAEVKTMKVPTMIVVGDWDAVRISHAAAFFELLGGGITDAGWDGSGMNANRLAILPNLTHYTIFMDPQLATTAIGFLDAPR